MGSLQPLSKRIHVVEYGVMGVCANGSKWRCTNYKRRFLPTYIQACPWLRALCPAGVHRMFIIDSVLGHFTVFMIVHNRSLKARHSVCDLMCDIWKYGKGDNGNDERATNQSPGQKAPTKYDQL